MIAGAAPTTRLLRAGIVGTGAIATSHAAALAASPHAELVGVVDRERPLAEAFAAKHGNPSVHEDLAALLAQGVDVVHVCTPPGTHAAVAIEALEAGAHVVVEKPPARSLAELKQMQEAAAKADRHLVVVFQQRSGSAAAHYRELLTSGALGRVLHAVCQTLWFRDQAYFDVPWRGNWATEGGGPTLGHAIHQIDLLAWLIGEPVETTAQLWRLARDTGTEDSSTATVRFGGGAIASIVTSAVAPREISSVRIDTERATLSVEHLYGHGHENWSITPAPGIEESEIASWRLPDVEVPSGHEAFLGDLYDAIAMGAPLPASAELPARAFELIAAIYASGDRGTTVAIDEVRADPTFRESFEARVTDLRPGA